MYIKEIILDGFKSYGNKTRIGPFDPHFNAITGLNGSGKSNVLDGICFVLGISSMSVVRCKNLADCIYKGHDDGRRSYDRATVSLVLDNSDKGQSPPGHEQCDELIVSRMVQKNGECRYHISGASATKRAVTDLFASVGLNVNHNPPNFLIMQGQVTKVVGMKPKEIAGMIEESVVGASLFQAKKDKADHELRIKQNSIDSINNVLTEHVKPNLDKQRRAHDAIQNYNVLALEKNDSQTAAAVATYFELVDRGQQAGEKCQKILQDDEKDDQQVRIYKAEIEQLRLMKKQQMSQDESSSSKIFDEKVKKAESAKKTEHAKYLEKEASVKTAREAVAAAIRGVKEAEAVKQSEEKEVVDFKNRSAKGLQEIQELRQDIAKANQELDTAIEQENQLRSGKILLGDDDDGIMDIDQELNRVTTEIWAIKPEVEDTRASVAEHKSAISELDNQIRNTPSDETVEREYKEKYKAFEDIKREASKRNIIIVNNGSSSNGTDEESCLLDNIRNATKLRDGLQRERNSITTRNYSLSFTYDKNRVNPEGIHGCLYDFIKVKNGINDDDEWGAALETALGSLLSQVVVDNDTIGKNLVKFGGMPRRTVVHPLNVFQSSYKKQHVVNQRTLDQKFGPGNAIFALNLLEFDPVYRPIVEHFVGGKVLCKDMEMAREIAFGMHLKAYTAAGDFVDPGGIMQGGSRHHHLMGRTIKDCSNLYRINHELRQLHQGIDELKNKLEAAESIEKFMETLEKAKNELDNADRMVKLTKSSQLKEERDARQVKLFDDTTKLGELEAKEKSLEKLRAQYQKRIEQGDAVREKNIRDNAKSIKKWEKKLETATKKYQARQKYLYDIEMDLKSKEDFLLGCQKDIDEAVAMVHECDDKLAEAEEQVRLAKTRSQKAEQAYLHAIAEKEEWRKGIDEVAEQQKRLSKMKEAVELNKMKRDNDRKIYEEQVVYCKEEITALCNNFNHIKFDKIERPKGGKSATVLRSELDAITQKVEELQQRLDHDAAGALDSTQRDFNCLADKLDVMNRDKRNLTQAIETLDLAKREKVRAAYKDVTAKFNEMMQTLLPEARARLVEVVPGDLSQGVNIHVQLGGVWKESLTELSGGQRSLVALSLVLSLCLVNPAPFYILDEVDAALDLSHTQNIGAVIQRQFKGTQFIAVSLKDGMFSHANVLFTAKQEGGKSDVSRSLGGQK